MESIYSDSYVEILLSQSNKMDLKTRLPNIITTIVFKS